MVSISPSKSSKKRFICTPIAALFGGFSLCAYAAIPPGAGDFSRQVQQNMLRQKMDISRPPLSFSPEKAPAEMSDTTPGMRVYIKKVMFTGLPESISAVSSQALQKEVAGELNKEHSFSSLEGMARHITNYLRGNGLIVARAVLPPQSIKDGVLTIRIIPGHYDHARIHNDSGLKTLLAGRIINTTTPAGDVVTLEQIEREALLLNEIPGVEASVGIMAGQKTGTTAPDITLKKSREMGGYVGIDNQGDRTTGRNRVIAGAYASNLAGSGDLLRVDLLDAYEKSELMNGALDYSLLAGDGRGTRVGMNYSHLNYRYNVNALAFRGHSDNWGVYATYPVVRTARVRIDTRVDAAYQSLTDKYPAVYNYGGDSKGRKEVALGTVSVTGIVNSLPGGLTRFGVNGTRGTVSPRSEISRSLVEFAGSSGPFMRLNYQLNHEQAIAGPLSFYAGINGQMASNNLDPSQKFLMGGPSGVRAYDTGDGTVDEGAVATAELRSRWNVSLPGMAGRTTQLTLAPFYDQGWGEQYRNNRTTGGHVRSLDNNLKFSGAGIYSSLGEAGNYQLTLTWAHKTGHSDPNAIRNERDRVWFTAVKSF